MYYDTESSGKRIKKLRTGHGISQAQLADGIGIHVKTISKAERGICGLSVDYLILISEYFQVTLDYLIMGKETKTESEILNLLGNRSQEFKAHILLIVKEVLQIAH